MLVSNKKKIITRIIITFFLVINIFTINSFAVVSPTADFYVNDYAGLLDNETKEYIINKNKILYSQTGAQIVVVTIQSLEDNSLEDYANELFRNFGIGDKTKNNGVLLLLALKERKFRVEVGYGLEGVLPDAKTGRMQDEYIIPYLKQDKWNEGIKNGFNAFLDVVSKEYNLDIGIEDYSVVNNTMKPEETFLSVLPMISMIVGIIVGFFELKKSIGKKISLIIALVYIIIVGIINMCIENELGSAVMLTILNIIFYIIGRHMFINKRIIYRGGASGGFFGGIGSSGGGSFGGGGSSGGGESSRSF